MHGLITALFIILGVLLMIFAVLEIPYIHRLVDRHHSTVTVKNPKTGE